MDRPVRIEVWYCNELEKNPGLRALAERAVEIIEQEIDPEARRVVIRWEVSIEEKTYRPVLNLKIETGENGDCLAPLMVPDLQDSDVLRSKLRHWCDHLFPRPSSFGKG